jgi:proteasome accessory factor C
MSSPGEELYTLRSEQYFLPELELGEDERCALRRPLFLSTGKFAYAEPLRLALQNLALGRPGFSELPTETAYASRCSTPTTRRDAGAGCAKLEGRDLEAADDQVPYYSISRDSESERTLNPYALLTDNGIWYVVAEDLDDKRRKKFRVSRIRGDIRFATRRERDFRTPTDFDIDEYRGRRRGRSATSSARRAIEVTGDTAWWVERRYGDTGGSRTTSSSPSTRRCRCSRRGCCARTAARAARAAELRREVARALRPFTRRTRRAAALAREAPRRRRRHRRAPAGPVTPERFAVLQALLAYLLARCGEDREATIRPTTRRALPHPRDELEDHLSLLNLVNFGGGCYTVYAELQRRRGARRQGALRRDVPRRAAADAARGARDPPRARVRRADDRGGGAHAARARAQEARGDVRPVRARADARAARRTRRRASCRPSARRSGAPLVEIEYQKEGEETSSTRVVEPYSLERELPNWRVHTWDRTRDGERSFRLDRCASAKLLDETFDAREGFEPSRLRDARTAQVLYTKEVARWALERGARRSRRHRARRLPVGSPSGSRARSSPTAARPSSSSPTTSARTFATARRSSRRSSASTDCAIPTTLGRQHEGEGRALPGPSARRPCRRGLRRSSAR